MTTQQVTLGFEAAHAEWLRVGGPSFRQRYRFGPDKEFYQSPYWQWVREAVLVCHEHKCCRCNGAATQAHHLNYNHIGEDHFHPETMVAVCRVCHGLVEYARQAEALISLIERRISLCEGFLEGHRGCREQNASHVYARLLEYRDKLAKLRILFSQIIPYSNPDITEIALRSRMVRFENRCREYEEQALKLTRTWAGTENDKVSKVIPMLNAEIGNCRGFIAEVFTPISPSVQQQTDDPF